MVNRELYRSLVSISSPIGFVDGPKSNPAGRAASASSSKLLRKRISLVEFEPFIPSWLSRVMSSRLLNMMNRSSLGEPIPSPLMKGEGLAAK